MKKILILALVFVMAGTMSACGMGDVGGPASSASASNASSQAVSSAVGSDGMENNLAGLERYLSANSAISGSPKAMKADFIGAKSGAKYQFGYNGKENVTVELYEFDLDNLTSQAKTVLDEAKTKKQITIMGQNVPVAISNDGKYIMIYKDTNNSDENKKHQKDVTTLFEDFQIKVTRNC